MNSNLLKISQSSSNILVQLQYKIIKVLSINGITKFTAIYNEFFFIKIVISEEELWFAVITYRSIEENKEEISIYLEFLPQVNPILPLGCCMIVDKRQKDPKKLGKHFLYRTYQKCNDDEGIDRLINEHIRIHRKVLKIISNEISEKSEGSMGNSIESIKQQLGSI